MGRQFSKKYKRYFASRCSDDLTVYAQEQIKKFKRTNKVNNTTYSQQQLEENVNAQQLQENLNLEQLQLEIQNVEGSEEYNANTTQPLDENLIVQPLEKNANNYLFELESLENSHTDDESRCPKESVSCDEMINAIHPSQRTQDPLHIGWSNKQSNTLHPQQQINILDPRSPASDFDRTPVILRVKTFDYQNSISPEHLSKVKEINSKLDIHFKLSYCETVSPFSITEIQALPDIVINLKRSCSVNAKLDKYILSTNNETTNIDSAESNSESNSMLTPKFIPEYYINEESFGRVCECQELLNLDNQETYCDIFNNVFSTNRFMQHANQCTHAEEKFTVCKDENSPKIPSNIFVYKPNYVAKTAKTICETEKSLIQSDDNILMNSMKNNPNKRIKKSNGKRPEEIERKEIKETKKEKTVMDEKVLFSLNYGNAAKVLKNRTPLANRSNINGKIQSLVTDSPQNIVRNKVLRNKVLQENTPPIKKKSVKNDTSTFDGTNWNPNSTFII